MKNPSNTRTQICEVCEGKRERGKRERDSGGGRRRVLISLPSLELEKALNQMNPQYLHSRTVLQISSVVIEYDSNCHSYPASLSVSSDLQMQSY